MGDPTSERGIVRIGVVLTAVAVLSVSLAVAAPAEALVWLLPAGLGVIGVGLLMRARFARALAGLLVVACGAVTAVTLVRELAMSAPSAAEVGGLVAIGNAIASTVLTVWLCFRALCFLIGRSAGGALTPRVVGSALVVVAASHLWLASQIGGGWGQSWSVRFDGTNMQLVGFALWPYWHGALLVSAAMLALGPRRLRGVATWALLAVFATLIPLVLIVAIPTGLDVVFAPILGAIALPTYLAWWLRDEVRADGPGAALVPAQNRTA